MSRLSALWLIPPVAVGLAAAVWFVRNAPEPARTDAAPAGLAVRIERIEPRTVRPLARGWGNIRAAESWAAVAEVRGQALWRHPDLEPGELIPAGTRVMEIDPADYRLAIAQAEADLAALKAESAQIEAEAENTARVLDLEKARLAISESDLARTRELVAQGTAAQTRADEAERAALLARRTVVELQNTLSLVDPRRDRVAAQTARTQAALARARRDLDHTAIVTPYDLRVTSVPTERFQYVNIGQTLLTGDSISRAEAVAQVPLPAFRRLLRGTNPFRDALAAIRTGPAGRIGAEVRLVSDPTQVWPATVSRVEGALDPRARTVPVVVTIENPYASANPPLRPPLVPNMQVEVTLTGHEIADRVVIPDSAVHGGLVYVMDGDGQLELRPIREAFRQDGLVIVDSGLAPGELLVLDNIAPAIPGMALEPAGDAQ
ncbi:MAG: efflux RND transporter periplasmic adaptor subunit [Jhaorihella sp.]